MNRKFLQFTIGAANALERKLFSANADYFISMTTTTVTLHAYAAHAASDLITITFATTDTTYASQYAVIDALALANSAASAPAAIIVPALPMVGATQQLITSVAIA
jgi:hypothetical protein